MPDGDNPHVPRYTPDELPETLAWVQNPLRQLLADIVDARARLLSELRALPLGA